MSSKRPLIYTLKFFNGLDVIGRNTGAVYDIEMQKLNIGDYNKAKQILSKSDRCRSAFKE